MPGKFLKTTAVAALALGAFALAAGPAAADTLKVHKHHVARAGTRGVAHNSGSQQLVSDGPGTSFGFHRDPAPFRIGARRYRNRQANAVQEGVDIDAATSGGEWGFPGDSVYGASNRGSYGVYDGADGYGSPYFAGFYGPGGGTDYGPFGHAYDD